MIAFLNWLDGVLWGVPLIALFPIMIICLLSSMR